MSLPAAAADRLAPQPAVAPAPWSQLLHDAAHTSVSPDQKLSATTASKIGLNWMSAMRSEDIGSPVAAYNTVLGQSVAYVADERGDVIAFNEYRGTTVWSTSVGFGNAVRAMPLVAPDGSVWVGSTYTPELVKLDGSTGKILCTLPVPMHINSSLMLATPPGGVATIYSGTNHSGVASGPEIAANESNCSTIWNFDKWLTLSGVWATPAYGVDVNGNGRVFIGTADPDSTLYSVDANTGKPVWNFSALNPPDGTYDVGAAATVSPPGNNGFADGVLYFPSKYGVLYALDLTTGKKIWAYNFNQAAGVSGGGRSSAALYKNALVYGMSNGVEAVNATTGTLLWHYTDPSHTEVLSSPAVAGPAGDEIVTFGDASGLFTIVRLSDGKSLYTYQTGNYITSSPAIINGHILIDSTDGFLYDFTNGNHNVPPPTTAITFPATGSKVANPGGPVTITGTASDSEGGGVTEVQLSVQRSGPNGAWYDASTNTWLSGATNNFVSVNKPNQKTSSWTFPLPTMAAGSTYQVFVNAVDLLGQVDRIGAQTSFAVMPGKGAPALSVSAALVPPATSIVVNGGPFAPNEVVDFTLQKVVIAHATANANGQVSKLNINVPASEAFGPSALTAAGETSHKATSAAVDITNIWTQQGYGPTHTGYEPNDLTLAQTLQSTDGGYLSKAWQTQTGNQVDTSPAIVGGLAYVANLGGTMSAEDTASGSPVWTYTVPSMASIYSSPAVSNGAVVFGAADGNLYRLSAAKGTLIGSQALGGVPTTPAIAGGIIYVGTDAGSVFAINEASGAQVWAATIGAAVHQAPAVDTTAGVVIVGDDSGTVTTLNLKTGVKTMQASTGGASVTVAPVVSSGQVFIAAADGILRTFSETSDKPGWTYNAGAAIHAVVSDSANVYVGSDSGNMARLVQGTGSVVFVVSGFASAVVGIGHSSDVSLVETANGNVNALKDDQGGRIQYTYTTGAGLNTQPAIVDGAVYVGAEDGGLYAFTSHGQAPEAAIERAMMLQLRNSAPQPANWVSSVAHRAIAPSRAFQPRGQRDFPLYLDRPGMAAKASAVPAGSATRTYVIGWSPVAVRAAAYVDRVRAVTGAVAGSAAVTTPYPRVFDDGAVQRELSRVIVANRWQAGPATRFLIVTAAAPVSSAVYCAYHSALDLGGRLTQPMIYGVVPAKTVDGCASFGAEVGAEWNEIEADPYVRNR
ncbi:MAG: PQQ-binding-like beta-propeller repeat protein [Candidatus Eremiobacteraeota bacterium]|nr:PQQ-binding-like beta-propeller repeat protein [Candidatus Eremiobacteraeota bacterium]